MHRPRAGTTVTERTPSSPQQLAGAVAALDALAERYAMLERHALDAPGRTVARRDHMRAISSRFPGALRELDCIGLDGVRRRAATVDALRERLAGSGDVSALADPEHAWIRYSIELVRRLRAALAIKAWLAVSGSDPESADARPRLRAWYADAAGGADSAIDAASDGELDDLLARIGSPPGGQVQQLAYRDAARALGVSVETLKRTLYPRPDSDPETHNE
jgi:hypothetical protein